MENNQTFSPVIRFGKHRGELLCNVDADYLAWLSGQEGFRGTIGGEPAPIAAAEELKRRKAGAPLHQPMAIEEAESHISDLNSKTEFRFSNRGIDDAIKYLLKNFLMRLDQSQEFTDWLGETLQEGTKLGKITKTSDKFTEAIQYMDLEFMIDRRNETLCFIVKNK